MKFATDACFYIYDTATNHILKVSHELWDQIDSYLALITDETPLGPGHDDVRFTSIRQQVTDGLAQGFLAPIAIQGMRFFADEADLRNAIANRVQQLTLELTPGCTASCHYCPYVYHQQRFAAPSRMNWDTLTNAVAAFMSHNAEATERTVSFWGGEPLLEFPVMQRTVDHISRKYEDRAPVNYQFTTNGTNLTDTVIDFLVRHNVGVVVSLDGPASIHDRHRVNRAGGGTFGQITANLRRILEKNEAYYRRRVHFACVLTQVRDIQQLEHFFSESELCRGHHVSFSFVAPTRQFASRYGVLSSDDRASVRLRMRSAVADLRAAPTSMLAIAGVKTLRTVIARRRSPVGQYVHPNGCCVPLLKKMHVTCSGNICLCERMDDDNCVGNVNRGGVDVDAAVALVREYCGHSIEDCRSCWAVRLCSGCYRDFMTGGQWSGVNRSAACDASRARARDALIDYSSILEAHPHVFDFLAKVDEL